MDKMILSLVLLFSYIFIKSFFGWSGRLGWELFHKAHGSPRITKTENGTNLKVDIARTRKFPPA